MTSKVLHILQHSLGVDEYGRGRQYRNHFVTGPGSDDFGVCQLIASVGLMEDHGPQSMAGGMHCFTVTREGIRCVSKHSPQPPKLSRSKRRYQEFLDADSGMSFGEWLRLLKFRKDHYA